MKKNMKAMALPIALMVAFGSMASGCAPKPVKKPTIDAPALDTATKVADLTTGAKDNFFAVGGYGNGTPFNVCWSANEVTFEEDAMQLGISQNANYDATGEVDSVKYPYFGGEYRSYDFYGYGDFGVSMKPSNIPGTASTFFTYTGEWDSEELHPSTGATDTKNPKNNEGHHDEIDIEFLGSDTTKVQFNYFTNGVGGHEYMYDLGFDASVEYHTYGFRWSPSRIIWFVDGEAVYEATEDIPTHPGRIITNYWCADEQAENWMGKYNHSESASGPSYQWFSSSTTDIDKTFYVPEEVPPTEDNTDWDTIEASAMGFESTEEYTVVADEEKKSFQVTYENLAGASYKNINALIPENKKSANVLSFQVKNNGTQPLNLRVDVNAAETHGTNQIKAINSKATVNGETMATDLEWGGSTANIAAGAEVTIVVWYEGVATEVMLMLDSAIYGDTNKHTNNITLSNFKFGSETVVEEEEQIDWVNIAETAMGFASTDDYTVTTEDHKTYGVTYSAIAGASYKNINCDIPAEMQSKSVVSFKVKNNGEQAVTIRVNMNAAEPHGANSITAINTKATINGETMPTDLAWGGSSASIPAGAESTIVVWYEGVAVKMELMLDSSVYGDTNTHAGNVTLSSFKFAGDVQAPEQQPQTGTALTFTTQNAYTITNNAEQATSQITYTEIADNSYANVFAGLEAVVGDNNVISFKITNNGTASVQFNIGVGYNGDAGLVSTILKDQTECDYFDESSSRAQFNVGAGASRVVTMQFDTTTPITGMIMFIDSCWAAETTTHAGDVTISEVSFTKVVAQTGGAVLSFNGNGVYTVNNDSATATNTITYTGVTNNSYSNVFASLEGLVGSNNTITFTITNNGTASVQFNIGIGYNGDAGLVSTILNTTVCDYFDAAASRAQFNVGAGESRTITMTFGTETAVTGMIMFIDSGWAETNAAHDGNVTLSQIIFSQV